MPFLHALALPYRPTPVNQGQDAGKVMPRWVVVVFILGWFRRCCGIEVGVGLERRSSACNSCEQVKYTKIP